MRKSDSEYRFDGAEVATFTESLRGVDVHLQQLARSYRLRLIMHSAKGWPGRTLYGRRWLKTYYLRISLNPAYVDTPGSQVRWDVDEVWMLDFAELMRRTLSYRRLAAEVEGERLAAPAFREMLTKAVAENFSPRR